MYEYGENSRTKKQGNKNRSKNRQSASFSFSKLSTGPGYYTGSETLVREKYVISKKGMTKGANAGRTQKKAGREQRNGLTTIFQAARRECRTLRELPSPSLHATGAKVRSGISLGVAPPGANVGVAPGEEAAAPGGGLALTVIQDPDETEGCLLYTSPSPRDKRQSRMPSSA